MKNGGSDHGFCLFWVRFNMSEILVRKEFIAYYGASQELSNQIRIWFEIVDRNL